MVNAVPERDTNEGFTKTSNTEDTKATKELQFTSILRHIATAKGLRRETTLNVDTLISVVNGSDVDSLHRIREG